MTETAPTKFERQQQILRLLDSNRRVTISQLRNHFAVSLATARRDLEGLADTGQVQRFHGGAVAVRRAPPEAPVLRRQAEQAESKRDIGMVASQLVAAGETVFLGSGTTVLEVARNLVDRRGLTVITNSLLVLNTLAQAQGLTVVALGGILRHSELSFVGHITEMALAQVRAAKVIIGIRALDIEHGLTNDYLQETMTDRAILSVGPEVIVVADHTKCERVSTAFVAPITAMHKLITSAGAPPSFVEALTAKGIVVTIA